MRFSRTSKVAAAVGISVLIACSCQAQGFYVKAGGGYNIGVGSKNGSNITIIRKGNPQSPTSQTIEEAEQVRINFGKGVTAGAAVGFMFNKQLGAELEISYLNGGDNETVIKSFSENATFGHDSSIVTVNTYSRMVMLQPSVVLSTDLSDKANLYGKFGIAVSKGYIKEKSESSSDQQTETRYEGGLGFGFQAALGFVFNMNARSGLFTEVRMSNLSYSPNNLHVEKKVLNGKDVTDSEPRDIPLEKAYTNINGQSNVNLKTDFPFSYVGLHFGWKYSF